MQVLDWRQPRITFQPCCNPHVAARFPVSVMGRMTRVTATAEREHEMDNNQKRLKQLELLGGLGAGMLGAGIGLAFARWLQPYALPLLVVGILSHGWAMLAKSRLERQSNIARPAWAVATEWVCWLTIAGLIIYVIVLSLP